MDASDCTSSRRRARQLCAVLQFLLDALSRTIAPEPSDEIERNVDACGAPCRGDNCARVDPAGSVDNLGCARSAQPFDRSSIRGCALTLQEPSFLEQKRATANGYHQIRLSPRLSHVG